MTADHQKIAVASDSWTARRFDGRRSAVCSPVTIETTAGSTTWWEPLVIAAGREPLGAAVREPGGINRRILRARPAELLRHQRVKIILDLGEGAAWLAAGIREPIDGLVVVLTEPAFDLQRGIRA